MYAGKGSRTGREIGGPFLSKYLQKARDGADSFNFRFLRRHSIMNKAAETMDKSTNEPMTAPTTASVGMAFSVDWVGLWVITRP